MESGRARSGGIIGTFKSQSGTVAGGDRIHERKLPSLPGGGPIQGQCRGTVRTGRQYVKLGAPGEPRQLGGDGRRGRTTVAVTRQRAGGRYRGDAVIAGPGR